MSALTALINEAAQERELWRYANPAKLERLALQEERSAWLPVVAGNYELINDADTTTLRVPENSTVSLDMLHVLASGQAQSKLIVQVGAGATLTARLGLQIGGDNQSALQKLDAIITLAEGATLNHVRWPQVGEAGYLFTRTTVAIAADGAYNYFCLTDCGAQTRHQLDVSLNGRRAKANLAGIYRLTDQQVAEHALRITHAAPDTNSQQFFRGTADGQSRGVFQGKIIVAKGADRTDAQQSHKALLLNPRAEIDTKPELEIHADEVKCSHGASIGALDKNALFYLQSRGISATEAQTLLTNAFVAEALQFAPAFGEQLQDRLDHAAA